MPRLATSTASFILLIQGSTLFFLDTDTVYWFVCFYPSWHGSPLKSFLNYKAAHVYQNLQHSPGKRLTTPRALWAKPQIRDDSRDRAQLSFICLILYDFVSWTLSTIFWRADLVLELCKLLCSRLSPLGIGWLRRPDFHCKRGPRTLLPNYPYNLDPLPVHKNLDPWVTLERAMILE